MKQEPCGGNVLDISTCRCNKLTSGKQFCSSDDYKAHFKTLLEPKIVILLIVLFQQHGQSTETTLITPSIIRMGKLFFSK